MRKPRGSRDVITLADLAPRHDVKGGSQRRVFGVDSTIEDRRDAMKPTMKDLTPKSPAKVKGRTKAGW